MITLIIEQGSSQVPGIAGTIGNGVKLPDRTAAVKRSAAQMRHWRVSRSEYGRGRGREDRAEAMMLSQKTCLRIKYRFLRP